MLVVVGGLGVDGQDASSVAIIYQEDELTRKMRALMVTTLAFGAVLAGVSPALAHDSIGIYSTCQATSPSGEGWHRNNDLLYGSCGDCLEEADLYDEGGWDAYCEQRAPNSFALWITVDN